MALATTKWSDALTPLDYLLIRKALEGLEARGFSREEAKNALRRLREKELPSADRKSEDANREVLPF